MMKLQKLLLLSFLSPFLRQNLEKAIGFHVAKFLEIALVAVAPLSCSFRWDTDSIRCDTALGTYPETIRTNVV